MSRDEIENLAAEAVGQLAAAASMLANWPEYGRVEDGKRLWLLACQANAILTEAT